MENDNQGLQQSNNLKDSKMSDSNKYTLIREYCIPDNNQNSFKESGNHNI